MSASEDPLRRLARERGRTLGELGLRPEDARWARLEGETLASLVRPALPLRIPGALSRLRARLKRAAR